MKIQKFRFFAIFIGLALFSLCELGAETQIILNDIKGKVEVKAYDATIWSPATEGMTVALSTTVSTGFDSSVTIKMDKNNLYIKPLTRMAIDKLVEDQGTVSTTCYLRVGSVKASIKSAEGVKQDFKVQSPYSTASVRGTVFTYTGLSLITTEGTVLLYPGTPVREFSAAVINGMSIRANNAGSATSATQIQTLSPSAAVTFASLPPITVIAGASVIMSPTFTGDSVIQKSSDLDSLRQSSTLDGSSTITSAGTTPVDNRDKGVNYGSLTVTVTLPSGAK